MSRYSLTGRKAICSLTRVVARRKAGRVISKIDSRPIPKSTNELRAFIVARNESLRLPFLLDSYFSRGVDRIFVLDHNSSDDTGSIVLSYKNTHLFCTCDTFRNKQYWIEFLLGLYGRKHWCLIVDADEIFLYPHYERVTLKQLCGFLDRERFNAVDCVLLDMYPNVPLNQVHYTRGNDPLLIASWFDNGGFEALPRGPIYYKEDNLVHEGPETIIGGMRKRVFGVNAWMSKFPLVKFKSSMSLAVGTHIIQGARVANIRGAVLHFKFLQDFVSNVEREAARKQYWNDSAEYQQYKAVTSKSQALNLYASVSTKFEGSKQLLDLGILKTSETLERLADKEARS
jgi:glycosyltransferase involved in cell wall biosynthesis